MTHSTHTIHSSIHTYKNEKPTMKLPVAVVLGATITTSAAAFAISRGSSVTRSGSLLSNIRNNYFQRNSMGSTTSARAASVEYAKSEIASNDVSFFYTHTDVFFYVYYLLIPIMLCVCRLSSSRKRIAHSAHLPRACSPA